MNIPLLNKVQFVHEPEKIEQFKASLKPGSFIYGKVIQSFGSDQYLVSLKGLNLLAQSDIPMKIGDRFKAKIQSTDPRLSLKITDTASENKELADKLNVQGDDRKILEEMRAAKLPVTKESFEQIRETVRRFSNNPQYKASPEEIARATVRLQQLNIPATADNMKGALLAVKNGFDIASILSNLQFFLSEEPQKLTPEMQNFLKNLPALFDPQNLAKNLPAAVNLLGLLHEAGLKNLLDGKIDRKINLKWLLLALEKMQSSSSSETPSKLPDLEGAQLRNLPLSRSVENDTAYLQIPVWNQNNWERMDVFFRNHSPAQKNLDKNNASIRINLDSQNLGKLSALADIQNGALSISLYFEQDDIASFIQPFLGELNDALNNIGYDVRAVSAHSLPPEMAADPAYTPGSFNHNHHDKLNFLA